MGTKQYINLSIRLVLLLINGVVAFIAFSNSYILSGWGLSLLIIIQILLVINNIRSQFMDIEKSLDCLLFDDYSNTIPIHKRKIALQNKMALLIEKQRKQNLEETSDKLIFNNIIESLSIGVLILKKDKQSTITVFQQNTAFLNFLKIPQYMHWDLLQPKLIALDKFINPNQWASKKHTVSINVNNQEENFFLKTSYTQTASNSYLILTLETIQQLIEKKEKESWYKLMNVMSHEIINTITPISSLAENLGLLLQDTPIDGSTISELSQGLNIINKRSSHLNTFVNTYRKLTELPQPIKSNMDLTQLVSYVITLYNPKFKEKGITLAYNPSRPFIINADKTQIEQVIINLISNSIHALIHSINPQITIELYQDSDRIYFQITDNGHGISEEIKSNIFIPYFTTRKDGSGIGLTLSKTILNAHNSFITLSNSEDKTTFIISFPIL